jgi:hypothetical protein
MTELMKKWAQYRFDELRSRGISDGDIIRLFMEQETKLGSSARFTAETLDKVRIFMRGGGTRRLENPE